MAQQQVRRHQIRVLVQQPKVPLGMEDLQAQYRLPFQSAQVQAQLLLVLSAVLLNQRVLQKPKLLKQRVLQKPNQASPVAAVTTQEAAVTNLAVTNLDLPQQQ